MDILECMNCSADFHVGGSSATPASTDVASRDDVFTLRGKIMDAGSKVVADGTLVDAPIFQTTSFAIDMMLRPPSAASGTTAPPESTVLAGTGRGALHGALLEYFGFPEDREFSVLFTAHLGESIDDELWRELAAARVEVDNADITLRPLLTVSQPTVLGVLGLGLLALGAARGRTKSL